MSDLDDMTRRTIRPNHALDPTYAKPPPWFVGSHKGVMIAVLALVAILIAVRVLTIGYLIDEWYVWWRAPVPTILPDTPPARTRATPIGNPGAWFASADYPPDARRAEEQGVVSIALLIGPDGTPSACEVTQSSGFEALDEATCRLAVRRGHFRPATDAGGQPVASRYVLPRVRWQLAP